MEWTECWLNPKWMIMWSMILVINISLLCLQTAAYSPSTGNNSNMVWPKGIVNFILIFWCIFFFKRRFSGQTRIRCKLTWTQLHKAAEKKWYYYTLVKLEKRCWNFFLFTLLIVSWKTCIKSIFRDLSISKVPIVDTSTASAAVSGVWIGSPQLL